MSFTVILCNELEQEQKKLIEQLIKESNEIIKNKKQIYHGVSSR